MALLTLCGCEKKSEAETGKKDEKRDRRYLVTSAAVHTRPVQYEVETTGSLLAEDIYRIDAEVSGVVEGVNFKEGDQVTSQTVLCRVAPRTYQLAAERAKAAYLKAKDACLKAQADVADTQRKTRNDIARAKIKLKQADRDVERVKPAFTSGAISQDEMLIAQDKRDTAAIELNDMEEAATTLVQVMKTAAQQKESEARQSEVEWRQAEEDVRKSSVFSPIAGTIDQRFVTSGMQVAPIGQTPVAQVVGPTLKLKFTLPEKESSSVREKTPLKFRVMAYPERDFSATIYYVSSLADPKTRLVTCYASIDKTDARLKSGFFATVRIVTEQRDKAIVVPLTAVLPTEQGFVTFVVKDGKAARRTVSLGLQVRTLLPDSGRAVNDVEVLKGLSEGEVVVVEGGNALQDGAPVREKAADAPKTKEAEGGVSKKEVGA
ncbi:MAG TPA: efflux RND transporter periplasmic adaptor subunit [Planctomycetota bacterium]|jgi:multidrug efflux system membrane fusion protein